MSKTWKKSEKGLDDAISPPEYPGQSPDGGTGSKTQNLRVFEVWESLTLA